jgi:hypothetical protein
MFAIIKRTINSASKLLAFTILTIVSSFFINTVFGEWNGPNANPPTDNLSQAILNGAGSAYLGNIVAPQYLTFEESALYPQKFYINSKKGLQLRVDSDNNENAVFAVNNGGNNSIFTLAEDGIITVAGRVTGVAAPIAGSDIANKAYVDALVASLCSINWITCYVDNDGDGYGGSSSAQYQNTCPAGFIENGGDCDDNDSSVGGPGWCYTDADGDSCYFGYYNYYTNSYQPFYETMCKQECDDSGGIFFLSGNWAENDGDCNDSDASACLIEDCY